jgi:hypothetical protein
MKLHKVSQDLHGTWYYDDRFNDTSYFIDRLEVFTVAVCCRGRTPRALCCELYLSY